MKRVDLDQWQAKEVARLLALVEAERRYYQEIIASMPVGLAVVSSDLTFLSANRSFRAVFGLTERALATTRLEDLLPAADVRDRVLEVLETGSAQRDVIVHYVSLDGPKPLRVSIEPFHGWNEESTSEALLVVQDADVVPTGDEAESQRQPSALLSNLDAVIWERDPVSLDFTYVSGRAGEILGFEPEEWTAERGFHEARLHPQDRDWVLAFYRATVASAESRSCEYRAITRAGHTVWLRDVIRVVRTEDGSPAKLSGITVNISSQKLRDEQLVQAEKMAALSRLAGKVTHDCNNLLMIVSGYSEELLDSLPKGHDGRDSVDEIIAATDRLSKLTTELLNFTRRPSLTPKEFSLNSLLESYEPALRQELGGQVDLQLELAAGLANTRADWDQTGDAILTLSREARQAMSEGGKLLIETGAAEIADGCPHVSESLPPGRYVTLSMTDTGPGLDEETRTRLFEPFFSSRRSGQDLPAVYSLIRNSGGDIRVTGGPGGGTRFTIYLPAVDPPQAPAAEIPAEPVKAAKHAATILLAEDEGGIRALIRKILRKQGYNVIIAASGEEALEVAAATADPIDLLLTDVVMPGINGAELASRLQAEHPEMSVLFMSGYTGEDLATFGPLPNGAELLEKPFSLSALLNKVRHVLA